MRNKKSYYTKSSHCSMKSFWRIAASSKSMLGMKTPVENWPLAFCNGSTVHPDELVETDHIRRGYAGAMLYLLYSSSHRWYFMNKQSKNDVALLKIFDSSPATKAKCKAQNYVQALTDNH